MILSRAVFQVKAAFSRGRISLQVIPERPCLVQVDRAVNDLSYRLQQGDRSDSHRPSVPRQPRPGGPDLRPLGRVLLTVVRPGLPGRQHVQRCHSVSVRPLDHIRPHGIVSRYIILSLFVLHSLFSLSSLKDIIFLKQLF